ncbi:hypothetical protein [Salinicola avicenniae]|uniref:hypothetical protein n=1 Tax=Salinicola avicenniae TaxID=2916836 RepID=UPI002072D045|nr:MULTISPECIES: hypothetical protein [unclassified Salinicola]
MTHMTRRYAKLMPTGLLAAVAILPLTAEAYVGPGAGLSLLTALWGIIAAIGMALFFVVAWPIRRMRRRRKAEAAAANGTPAQAAHVNQAAQDPETPPTTRQVEESEIRSPESRH